MPSLAAFCSVSESASRETSARVRWQSGLSAARVRPRTPEPQPMSSMSSGAEGRVLRIISASSSVSGRGMRARESQMKSRP